MEKNKGKIKGLLIIVLSVFLCNQDLYSQSYKEQRRIALLCELLEKEEKSGYFDEARYLEIVFSLNQYYTNNNDIHYSSELLHNAIRTVNAKSKELNTPNIRKLYLLLGRMEATLKCYNDAIGGPSRPSFFMPKTPGMWYYKRAGKISRPFWGQ